MDKIRQKPIEKLKTVIIAFLTVTMLALAALYIGGSQFSQNSAAINSVDMPNGAVAAGDDAPLQTSVYEKNLLAVSFIGIRYGSLGGGSYMTEQAARDLFEFTTEPLHALLSSSAAVSEVGAKEFADAVSKNRYICLSLVSALPYQIVYALSGEYIAPLGSETAINPETLLISFDEEGNATLYMREKETYYAAVGDCTLSLSELSAMASDSRLYDFEIKDGMALSENAPLVQTLSLLQPDILEGGELQKVLSLLDYGGIEGQPSAASDMYTVVAPHGNLHIGDGKIIYTATDEGGIGISSFLDIEKSELDIALYDILLSSVSLVEELRESVGKAGGSTLDVYLDGFYQNDDVYTIIFGVAESSVPLSGSGFPYLAKITVQGGKFKSVEFNFISAERSGYALSPFSSAWEYRHASKTANVSSISLRYYIDALPLSELSAAWYFTGERTVAK